jgi:hypothetical protein
MEPVKSSLIVTIARWAARIAGTLMVLLFVFMFVGEAAMASEPFPGLTTVEALEMAAVVVMLVGTLLAWRWETLGGAMTLAGGIFFIIVESLQENRLRPVWFAAVFAVVGAIFIACRLADNARRRVNSDAP